MNTYTPDGGSEELLRPAGNTIEGAMATQETPTNRRTSQRLKSMVRRDFLRHVLAAAATAAIGPGVGAAGESPPPGSRMPTRRFGKTGHDLPILGMGSSPMVAQWSREYGAEPASVEQRAALVRHAYERGIRYFDTGRVYGDTEGVIGQGLKGVRGECFVATKVAATDPAMVRRSVERSLTELGMDRVDLVQVHSPAIEAVGFEGGMKIHAELLKLRDERLFRFIGLTTHVAFEDVYKMIATGGFDQVLLAYGYFRRGMDTLLSDRNLGFRERCLDKAHELRMAVVAMKVMGAGILGRMSWSLVPEYDRAARERLPGAAMRWVMNDQRVSLMIIGMGHAEELDQNAAILAADLALTEEDRHLLADYSARAYDSKQIKRMRVV